MADVARSMRVAVAVAGLAGAFGVGTLVAWEPAPPLASGGDGRPEAVAITTEAYDAATVVAVEVAWSPAKTIDAPPGLGGTVTASACVDGATISSGTRLVDVDGIGRTAFHTTTPFYRPLALGATGPDVAELRRVLDAGGSGSTFDAPLAEAVAAHDRRMGGAGRSDLEPSMVVFLPSDQVEVASCDVAVGRTVESGAPLATEAPRPTAVTTVGAGGAGGTGGAGGSGTPEAPGLDGAWVLDLDGATVPVERVGDGTFATPVDADLDALDLAPPTAGGVPLAPPEATIRLVEPIKVAVVPAAALVVQGGASCLATGAPGGPELRPVRVLDARLGTARVVAVDGRAIAGRAVAPAAPLAGDRPCRPR